jgi:hypothetical protein
MTQDQLFKQMTPDLQALYEPFYTAMFAAGLPFELNEVLRTPETQKAYYAQNRKPLTEVNRLRKIAGIAPITAEDNTYKITWTLDSKHFAGADGLARAFDIRLLKYGKPHWATKWDGNKNSIPDYLEASRIGESVGLSAGGLWNKPDYPHFQINRSAAA